MSLLGTFALIAFIVRGLVPAGYMLETSAEPGQFVKVAICHGDGGTGTLTLDLKTGKYVDTDDLPGQSDPDQKASSCPYAMTAFFSLPAVAVTLNKPVYDAYAPALEIALVAPGQGLAAPPPPPRAPPLTV